MAYILVILPVVIDPEEEFLASNLIQRNLGRHFEVLTEVLLYEKVG